jgi:hypothetical protein
MTIDPNTGLIEWRPTATGDYDVTVQASNSEGTDEQTFTIHVAEAPACPIDMISYWKLDETSSGAYADYYDGNDGACSGTCPTPGTGIVNGAQVFSRSSGMGIDVPADASFDWGKDSSFSIEYWMKGVAGTTCVGSQTADNEVIVGRDDASTGLHIWTGCNASGGGVAAWQLRDTSGDGIYVPGTTPINDGEWYHVVVVRDGASDMNYVYVDGALEGSGSYDYAYGFGSATAALNLGWLNLSAGYYYTGHLDEVAIYNRALTAAEIQHHYQASLAGQGYCELGPVAPSITLQLRRGGQRLSGANLRPDPEPARNDDRSEHGLDRVDAHGHQRL